jgi:hypothetical protein
MTPDPECVEAMIYAQSSEVPIWGMDDLGEKYYPVTLNGGPYDGMDAPMKDDCQFVSISVTFCGGLVATYGKEDDSGVHFCEYKKIEDIGNEDPGFFIDPDSGKPHDSE